MFHLQTLTMQKPFSPLCSVNMDNGLYPFSLITPQIPTAYSALATRCSEFILNSPIGSRCNVKSLTFLAVARNSGSYPDCEPDSKPKAKPRSRSHRKTSDASQNVVENPERSFPTTIPRKPRRGRRSESVAVEDFVRDSLERTFESIRQHNPNVLEGKEYIMKDGEDDDIDSESSDDDDDDDVTDDDGKQRKNEMVVEEESSNWPVDADVGWGIRASEYFEQYPIKNVVGEDGLEIDWEGEVDDNWVQEINCLEWESFAFHPSPLIVLVFERYNRATDNWKTLKELEKAAKVYWSAKDRLPPRTVKIDINIEKDLAYALKVKECPQILFLRGNKIVYREQEFRTADELVTMFAYFYYNAKKPACINDAALSPH
ncbi:hypothetical protein CFOL_v3_22258 [Cephalotus follicularis]|uniref:Thioredoxin domain-containing protein n=1 Tax=Cephalotus follicularis TaxID=3775 RepID=A0A1Q3CFD3_CEPFO|nr:hypothetical protein CFOL_v3_22258 [Cephalotus follicularis]